MIWHPELPEPRPAFVLSPGDPEPVPLEALRHLRDLIAGFRVPPRQFRRRTAGRVQGTYYPRGDIVAVDRDIADSNGMGGDDGYYVSLLHELLHATGHPRRLGRPTTGDYSDRGYELEEGTVVAAQTAVLREVGFDEEAIEWHAIGLGLPVDRAAAAAAAAWALGATAGPRPADAHPTRTSSTPRRASANDRAPPPTPGGLHVPRTAGTRASLPRRSPVG